MGQHNHHPQNTSCFLSPLTLPCVIPPITPAHRETGGKWEWLTQLRKDQNTKIQQFLLNCCHLVSVPQPMSMLSCRYSHAGTVEEATGMWTGCQGRWGCFSWQHHQLMPVKSKHYLRPYLLQDEVSFEMCLFGFLLSFQPKRIEKSNFSKKITHWNPSLELL